MAYIAKDHNGALRTSVPTARLAPRVPDVAGHLPAGEQVRPIGTAPDHGRESAPTARTEARHT